MKINWKHVTAILAGVSWPALVAALQGQALSWPTLYLALGSAATVTFAAFLQSPLVDPGVKS
jgi:hypothetical protein